MRVLIVDDDLSRTALIRQALKKRNHGRELEVWTAQSSLEAENILDFMGDLAWDVIFLDHDLLGSLGYYCEGLGEGADGRTVANAMIEFGVTAKNVVVQSVNWMGGPEIKRMLDPHYKVILAPFPACIDLIEGKPKREWRKAYGLLTQQERKTVSTAAPAKNNGRGFKVPVEVVV